MEEFTYSVKIRNRDIKIRKWKVKDKLNFIKSLKSLNYDDIIDSLVYNCIEDKTIVLSPSEFKYVFLKMRELNVSPYIQFDMVCTECNKEYTFNSLIDDIFQYDKNDFSKIELEDINIEINELTCSKEIYNNIFKLDVSEYEKNYMDFLLHISKINGEEMFTFDNLIDYFNEMNVDTFEKIFEMWNKMKFKLSDEIYIKCPHCDFTELYTIDKIPTFFPESWF